MAVTDPIADLLARVRNAIRAGKSHVQIPASKLKVRVAEVLKTEGFISDYTQDRDTRQGLLTIQLKWQGAKDCAIRGLRRRSRPGRRHYVGYDQIPRVQSGLGIAILTTSHGVMTDRQAREKRVGGELICEVW